MVMSKVAKMRRLINERGIGYASRFLFQTTVCEVASYLVGSVKLECKDDPFYKVFDEFIRKVNSKERPMILEVGARDVSDVVRKHLFKDSRQYVGFDVLQGENVDVVGDAHNLSSYFQPQSFDAVFAVSVFEHLAMPWKVVLEMNKILKPGGLLFVSTHPTWPSHELPWDFWRFQQESFKILLNDYTGFNIILCEEGVPGRIMSMSKDLPARKAHRHLTNLAVAVMAEKTGEVKRGLSWDIDCQEVLQTMYPKRSENDCPCSDTSRRN